MSIQEYLLKIKEKFPYLFDVYGFRIAYTKEFRFDHYSIGLESDMLRLLFEQERGGWGIFVGKLDASFDHKKNNWVNIYSLLPYLLKREVDWSTLSKYPYLEQVDVMLSLTARELAPLFSQIVEMFRSPDTIAQWKPAYDQYVKDKIENRIGKKR
ncbi:MAG: hypothetical protein QY332_18150 [Anaerolineales bacterium]|nr:MAG: hypothetical protein QY332_18150 [Anaerolineales bacterium]